MIHYSCLYLVSFAIVWQAQWTIATNNTYISCSFENDDICGFEQMTDDTTDWVRHRGSTEAPNTGPSQDHTSGTGYYMYVGNPGGLAKLASPFQNATDVDGMCLEFFYHMYGISSNTLSVYVLRGINGGYSLYRIFTTSRNQGDRWWQALVNFNLPSSHWRIIFQTSSYSTDIAIDDVFLTPGLCPTQEPFYQDWTTSSVPDVTPWGDIQGIRLSGGTHLDGRLEVLYDGVWGTVCGLTGWGGGGARVACKQLGFKDFSYSNHQGASHAYDKSLGPVWMSGVECSGQESSLSDCQHDGFGNNNNSCTHTNDVQILCREYARLPDNSTCTFEHDMCNFYNLHGDDFDWTRHRGSTLSTDTGPSGDHTTGTGYYMYVETSSGTVGWEARLASVTYVRTDYQGLCLNFYYHMYGSSVGTLNVLRTRAPGYPYQGVNVAEVIFTASEDRGNRWRRASAHFSYSYDWGIVFEVIRGSSYTGDIAIDDVSFIPGLCPTQEPTAEDVVLRCASSSFQVDIPENLIEGTYDASDFYLSGDPYSPACKGFYYNVNGARYISLNSSLTGCSTQFYQNGSQLLYQNMIEINPSDGNSVVDFLGIEIPITCEYNSSSKLQTHFKTLNDVIRKKEKGSFDFDFSMYTDKTYSTRYYSYPVETRLNRELYFRAELLRSASNLEIHLRGCRATPSPHYDDAVVYEFIRAGCGINDVPVRVLTPNRQTQADFEITSFRFRKDLSHPESQIWIHCEVVVCDVNDSDSECRHGCEQPRHRRSIKNPPLKTKRMVQGPIILSNDENGHSDSLALSENNDGFQGILTTFPSALSLIMLVGFVAMGVALIKVLKSSKHHGYQPLPNPPIENEA